MKKLTPHGLYLLAFAVLGAGGDIDRIVETLGGDPSPIRCNPEAVAVAVADVQQLERGDIRLPFPRSPEIYAERVKELGIGDALGASEIAAQEPVPAACPQPDLEPTPQQKARGIAFREGGDDEDAGG